MLKRGLIEMAEYDISAELEKDQVEYERKHKKDIRLSMLDEKTGKFIPFNKKKYLAINRKGWRRESIRHGLAARGIKTGRKKLLAFVKEEKQTAKDYKRRGFVKQGKQEAAHAKFFEKKLKGVKKQ
jgi:hypothetical protein